MELFLNGAELFTDSLYHRKIESEVGEVHVSVMETASEVEPN